MARCGKIVLIGMLAILISSVVSVDISTPVSEKDSTTTSSNYDDIINNGYQTMDNKIGGIHTVFVEDGTAGWCSNCPDVDKILSDLYDSGEYPFYYVSLVSDENDNAYDRLYDDYNMFGFPTVFFDGGYEVVFGLKDESYYIDKISSAASREAPDLYLNVSAEWNHSRNELDTTVVVQNNESESYNGNVKIYVTEIVSRWFDYDGVPYRFAFLDYAMDEDISIPGEENISLQSTWNAADGGFPDVDPVNIMVYTAVFNASSTIAYSDPPSNKHPFDAYYADQCTETRVAIGNLPPAVGIVSPKKGNLHIIGEPKLKTLFQNTILIGRTTIVANVSDSTGVEKVEFYVEGRLGETNATIWEEPYEWLWNERAFGRYTIYVKAYDTEGKSTTVSLDVIAFII